MAQFPWFSWVALKIELAKCFVFSMWQQNQTNFFPLYVSVQMIKLQGVCSRNFERRRGQDEHRLKIMNYMYCMFIKRTIPGGVNKKIVINNGNIITYKMLYIPVGMLLIVYLETFAMKRWIALAIPFSTATLPIFAPLWSSSKLLYFQRVGRTTESNNWFNCIVVSLRYCWLTIFLTIPGVRKARDGLLRCNFPYI